jgi:hypothetical protein
MLVLSNNKKNKDEVRTQGEKLLFILVCITTHTQTLST